MTLKELKKADDSAVICELVFEYYFLSDGYMRNKSIKSHEKRVSDCIKILKDRGLLKEEEIKKLSV